MSVGPIIIAIIRFLAFSIYVYTRVKSNNRYTRPAAVAFACFRCVCVRVYARVCMCGREGRSIVFRMCRACSRAPSADPV